MRVIEVESAGLLTTVQDLGRPGHGAMGVSASGAADAVSLRVGNRLVGNAEGAAALEMTLLGGTFRFPHGGAFVLAGSDFEAKIDGVPVAPWIARELRPGDAVRVGPTRSGARSYLCVQGGIAVKPFLGSASTHLLTGLGGYAGRALRKGDLLRIGNRSEAFHRWSVANAALEKLAPRKILRVTLGPQNGWFSLAARKQFLQNTYRVSEDTNRTGLRLDGTPLPDLRRAEMITEGIPLGAVQITAAGLPIILFVEQQTTGGYAKIASVIAADLHSVGQLRPRDEIRFALVDFEEAHRALLEQEELIRGCVVEG
jgi:antagonist of KipI